MEPNPNEVTNQPTTTSTQAPVFSPENKQKKSHKILFFLSGMFIVLILVGGIGGGYYFGRSSVSNELTQVVPSVPPKDPDMYRVNPTPEANSDKIADWKTYNNTRFGFTMKYPDKFVLEKNIDDATNTEATQETKLYQVIIFRDSTKKDSSLVINLAENSNFPTNESYRNFVKTKPGIQADIKDLEVDGANSLIYTYLGGAPGLKESLYSTTVDLSRNSKTYTFTLSNLESDGQQEDLLKKILSTFKFTN